MLGVLLAIFFAALVFVLVSMFGAAYLKNMSLETAHAIVVSLAREVRVPVCLHLDHCSDLNVIYRAIKAGFGSVMYDGSMLPFAENVTNTHAVCHVAHACGVSVEAELGSLAASGGLCEGGSQEVYRDVWIGGAPDVQSAPSSLPTKHPRTSEESDVRGCLLMRNRLAVVMIDADHDGRCLDDGVCLLADLKTELCDGVHADRRGDDIAALELDADDAVDGPLLDGDNLTLELIACTEFHVFPSLIRNVVDIIA